MKTPEGESKQAVLGNGVDGEEYAKHLMAFHQYAEKLGHEAKLESAAKAAQAVYQNLKKVRGEKPQDEESPTAKTLAGNVGKCVCRLHPSNDRHFCLSPTCRKCRPNTSATFCYVGQFFRYRRRVGETYCRHTLLHARRNKY